MSLRSSSLLGPGRCAGCGARAGTLCASCAPSLRPPPEPVELVGADRTLAAFAYEGPARGLVLALKARGLRDCSGPLADGMVAVARRAGLLAQVVTWVPARPHDVSGRGFDHARVLAQEVARSLGLPAARLLLRADARRDQVGLSAPDRRRNLRGAFRARPAGGRRVLLVDDLLTTGSTAKECVSALRASGAGGVEVLVACRA